MVLRRRHSHCTPKHREGGLCSRPLLEVTVFKWACWHKVPAVDTHVCTPGDPERAPYYAPDLSQLQSANSLASLETQKETLLSVLPEILKGPNNQLQSLPTAVFQSLFLALEIMKGLLTQLEPLPATVCEQSYQHRDLAGDTPVCASRDPEMTLSLALIPLATHKLYIKSSTFDIWPAQSLTGDLFCSGVISTLKSQVILQFSVTGIALDNVLLKVK
ncbi:hypothetical protein PAL_GLEAN10015709 [Pteropus alecto]|uniref:Uncharacterized protein n=1 Tax=Pteropus alecto TaxID=9402 RepID=L5KKF2_PTEAL|nr:hypothetical protein PAL_GLEAN10015709 [Pteropus alecto]